MSWLTRKINNYSKGAEMNIGQKIIDIVRGKKSSNIKKTSPKILPKTTKAFDKSKKIIAIGGFCWSGSGALVDLLAEFDNAKVYSEENIFSGDINKAAHTEGEFKFFINKHSIFNLRNSFDKNEFEQDVAIKQFIAYFYEMQKQAEFNDAFGGNFIDINIEFLESILDLDEYTKKYMSGKKYPHTLFKSEETYKNCSFVYDKCPVPYIFYRFKRGMTDEEFDNYVADYIYDFFNNIKFDKYLILDQFFSNQMLLDTMNFYKNEYPIKEVCVYRDPRDQYVSWFKECPITLLRSPEAFIKYCKKRNLPKIHSKSPNRMCIRFEDIIFKYEETIPKVLEFLEVDEKDHVKKGQIFIPEISRKNVGIYKTFHDQKAIEMIKKELSELCYE